MSNLDYEREDEEDLLNQAEEFKIIASCILRIKELKDLRYTTSRILLDGVVQIGIDFEVQLEASIVNIIKKLLSRELFEYGRNENEYKLLIGEK